MFLDSPAWEEIDLYYASYGQMDFMAKIIAKKNKDLSNGKALTFEIVQAMVNDNLTKAILNRYSTDMDILICNTEGDAKVEILDLKHDTITKGSQFLFKNEHKDKFVEVDNTDYNVINSAFSTKDQRDTLEAYIDSIEEKYGIVDDNDEDEDEIW